MRNREAIGRSHAPDHELVAAIAEQTGAQETLLASLDETARTRLDDLVREAVDGTVGTAREYVRQVAGIAGVLKSHGGAVVIGRGVQFILAPEKALRVRVIRPQDQRVASFAERRGIPAKEADRIVRRVERERRSFIRRHYDATVGDAIHYDLVINTACLPVEAAAAVVVAAYEDKFGHQPDVRAPGLRDAGEMTAVFGAM